MTARVHGGPDGRGAARYDFSVNANACGPCPPAIEAVRDADRTRYPDPAYTQLRERIAAFHGVAARRVVIGGSGSELIFRLTAWAARRGLEGVNLPQFGYGDYELAARAHFADTAIRRRPPGGQRCLAWHAIPSSPFGRTEPLPDAEIVVLDLAYEPLRLAGDPAARPDDVWQLWTPNKALGLAGVRGAYAIAPAAVDSSEADALAPSWVLGADGVAMLLAWCEPGVQQWLAGSRATLRLWKARQAAMLRELGCEVFESDANFMVVRRHPGRDPGSIVPRPDGCRIASGMTDIRVRDCTSFGLPGHDRLSVQPPEAQDALRKALA